MNNIPYRVWINQPSTLQPLHHLHGKKCIAWNDRPNNVRLFFTDGPIHSMDVDPKCVTRVKLSSAEN